MNKNYVVVYRTLGGTHRLFRCMAKTERSARKICRDTLGIGNNDIVEVYTE